MRSPTPATEFKVAGWRFRAVTLAAQVTVSETRLAIRAKLYLSQQNVPPPVQLPASQGLRRRPGDGYACHPSRRLLLSPTARSGQLVTEKPGAVDCTADQATVHTLDKIVPRAGAVATVWSQTP